MRFFFVYKGNAKTGKDDPFYLSEEASLGVLSADGNFE